MSIMMSSALNFACNQKSSKQRVLKSKDWSEVLVWGTFLGFASCCKVYDWHHDFFLKIFFSPSFFWLNLESLNLAKKKRKEKEFSKCVKKKTVFFLWILVATFLQIKKNQQISLLGSSMWRNFNVKEFLTALLSYPLYSQIWLKFIMDDYQFSHIHKYEKKNPLIGTSVF
jgi:hypothetical protein